MTTDEVAIRIVTSFFTFLNPLDFSSKMNIITIVGFEIPLKKRGADMRVKNKEISDAILKFVNKYFHENRKAPTIS